MNTLKIVLALLILCLVISCQDDTPLFQDSFEGYTTVAALSKYWTITGNGKLALDQSKAYSGKQSVHIVSSEGYANRVFMTLHHLFPIASNHYYGRMKLYLKEASPDGIHWTMIQSTGTVEGENYRAEIRYGGQHQKRLMANYDTKEAKSDCWQHSMTPIPEEKWCDIQWEFDGFNRTMRFWLDGQLLQDLTVKKKGEGCVNNDTAGEWFFPEMENVSLGWVDYQQGGGNRELWIDDVVISNTPFK